MAVFLELYYRSTGARAVIDRARQRLPAGWGQALDRQGGIFLAELAARTPRGPQAEGGRLAAGWRMRSSGAGANAVREIYNIEPYLRFVLSGRGPIDQRQKPGAKRLRFYIGTTVYYRWAVGPVAAHPFHLAAYAAARRRVADDLQGSVRTLIFRDFQDAAAA